MKRNLGHLDRIARLVALVPLVACALVAPWPLAIRIVAFAVPAGYLLLSAWVGTCIGYRMMGKSTCPVRDAFRAQ